MPTNLAKSTFSTRANEVLAAVDAYSIISGKGVKNILPDPLNALNIKGLLGLKGGNLAANLGINFFTKKGGALTLNADGLLKGVLSAVPSLNSAYSMATGAAKTALDSMPNALASVTATVNGVTRNIVGASLLEIKAVGNMIGSLAGSSNFAMKLMDISGLSSVSTNLIAQGSALGIPGVYSSMALGIGSSAIMNKVTSYLVPYVINRCDTPLLKDMAYGAFSDQIKSTRSSFVQDYSKGYTNNRNIPQHKYEEEYNDITGSWDKIDDSWRGVSNSLTAPIKSSPMSYLDSSWSASPDMDLLQQSNADRASVVVPRAQGTNYAALNTSVGNVPRSLRHDADQAQNQALKNAFPAALRALLFNPKDNLNKSFPTVKTERYRKTAAQLKRESALSGLVSLVQDFDSSLRKDAQGVTRDVMGKAYYDWPGVG